MKKLPGVSGSIEDIEKNMKGVQNKKTGFFTSADSAYEKSRIKSFLAGE